MQVAMLEQEQVLLRSFLRCSTHYLEFGSGGSTFAAASLVGGTVLSVESSAEWVGRVREACAAVPRDNQADAPRIDVMHVDIGPVGGLGYPQGEAERDKWPNYHAEVWRRPESRDVDLCLVDGRFRVACFIQAVLHCDPQTVILIHDFDNRPHYHVVKRFAREFARVDSLSAFRRRRDFDAVEAVECLQRHAYDTA